MGGSIKVGRAFGIDVKVHWTFLLLLAFFGFTAYQNSGSLGSALVTVGVIVALFVCVLLHEYGHSLVAQRLGIEIADITILPIGGAGPPKTLPQGTRGGGKNAFPGPPVHAGLPPPFFCVGHPLAGGIPTPPQIPPGGQAG